MCLYYTKINVKILFKGVKVMSGNISYIGTENKLINDTVHKFESKSEIKLFKGYIGFPHYKYNGEAIDIDAIIITNKGVLAIIDGTKNKVNLDDVYSKIKITLMNDPQLIKKREIFFDIDVYSINSYSDEDNWVFDSPDSLVEYYLRDNCDLVDQKISRIIIHNIEGCLSKEKKCRIQTPTTEVISKLESYIANYDRSQLECLRERNEKVQAISGLAGSGKTVILCKKISELLLNDDKASICITFSSRSLKDQIKKLIKTFLEKQSDVADLLMERVNIMNSWGNSQGDGFYSMVCNKVGIEPIALYQAKVYDKNNPFSYVCSKLLDYLAQNSKISTEMYDYIFVDEAQDLNEIFLKLCFKCLNENGKLVYAYDEFQDLSDNIMKSPNEIFGDDVLSIVTPLDTCYRTPKEILISAHSIGMGINSSKGICQFFDNESIWNTIGYSIVKSGEKTIIDRKTAEVFNDINKNDLIVHKEYDTIADLESDLVDMIELDLKNGFLHEDIMIVDLAKWETAQNYEIFKKYSNFRLNTALAGDTNPNVFFEKEKIIYSYVHRAKGNEAYKIYIVNSQLSMTKFLRDQWRNRLFTAMTRSKWQVVLLSVKGSDADELINELDTVRNNGYRMIFEYPNAEQIAKVKKLSKQNLKTTKAIEDTRKGIDELTKLSDEESVEHLTSILRGKLSKEQLDHLINSLNKKDE